MIKLLPLLLEAREYANDDIIDFNDIDLYTEYGKLNALLFDGQLTNNIEILWGTPKGRHGQLRTTRNTRTRQILNMELRISKFRKLSYKLFKDTLAHEMIHVKLMQNWISDNHGPRFIREMNRINGMGLGFDVKIRDDRDDLPLTNETPLPKPVVFILIDGRVADKASMIVITRSGFDQEKEWIYHQYQKLVDFGKYKQISINSYESIDPRLRAETIRRNLNGPIYFTLVDNNLKSSLISSAIRHIESQTFTK